MSVAKSPISNSAGLVSTYRVSLFHAPGTAAGFALRIGRRRTPLIVQPAQYTAGLRPAGGLSALDIVCAKMFYPGQAPKPEVLTPFSSHPLTLGPGEQADFALEPEESRDYTISSFGTSDVVMVLFEDDARTLRYLGGDDDGGSGLNARMHLRLLAGRRYVLRLRMYWAGGIGRERHHVLVR